MLQSAGYLLSCLRVSRLAGLTAVFALATVLTMLTGPAALALSDASAQAAPYTVTDALIDQVSKTTLGPAAAKAQGLGAYNLAFHDHQSTYTLPLCAEAALVEADGRYIGDAATLTAGDAVVASVQAAVLPPPAPAGSAGKPCVGRIVRQSLSRASIGGECLQDYQVKHEVEGRPAQLIPDTDYAYQLTVYARPTLDCDGQTYGSAPITTAVAAQKPFVVTLLRGQTEIKRWSLSTDVAGKVRFTYAFQSPANNYKFLLSPAVATAGDVISWGATVVDPHPSPSPAAATPKAKAASPLPIIVLIILILAAAAGTEYWYWRTRRRKHELPEDEYKRVSKL